MAPSLINKKNKTKNRKLAGDSRKKRTTIERNISARAPTTASCEIPILHILLVAQVHQLPAKDVIKKIAESGKWFEELTEDDLLARYPGSKRKIVETVIKYARKNLVLKGQSFPAIGDDDTINHRPAGVWEMTPKGFERLRKDQESWKPKYSIHKDSVIIVKQSA